MAGRYARAGVDQATEEQALRRLVSILHETYGYRTGIGRAITPIGHHAGIIHLTNDLAIALKTDGVGTKVLVAQMMEKYDTVGIDCIAAVVNDVICVGAEPLSVLDYLAVQKIDSSMIEQIGVGLRRGAELARVNVVGGEIAQVRTMIRGISQGKGFDLIGMCVGKVDPGKIIDGQSVKEGDLVVGIESSGVHCNGLTLARRVLFDELGFDANRYVDEIGRTIGEELLEPTAIYVREIMDMIRKDLHLKNIAHIATDGLLSLSRTDTRFGYVIDNLPKPHPIFELIQREGRIDALEMYRAFNMGVGLCFVVPKEESDASISIVESYGHKARVLGQAVKDPERRLVLKQIGIVGFPLKRVYGKSSTLPLEHEFVALPS